MSAHLRVAHSDGNGNALPGASNPRDDSAATRQAAGILSVGIATLFAATLGWIVLLAMGRLLGPSRYAEFAVLWGFYFAIIGMFSGIGQETTRSLVNVDRRTVSRTPRGSRPLVGALILGILISALLGLSAVWWGRAELGTNWPVTLAAIMIGIISVSMAAAVGGALAANHHWKMYSLMVISDPLTRLFISVGLALVVTNTTDIIWGIVAGSVCWPLFLATPHVRNAVRVRGASRLPPFLTKSAHAMVASGCATLLVAGFPALLRLTSNEPLDGTDGIVLAAVMLTRAPLLIPLTGYQLVILARLVRIDGNVYRRTLSVCALASIATIPIAGLSYFFGPWLIQVLYGPQFRASPSLLALLAIAAVSVAALAFTGMVALAMNRHVAYACGWLVATAIVTVILATSLPLETRVSTALCIGPLGGLILHLRSIRSAQTKRYINVESSRSSSSIHPDGRTPKRPVVFVDLLSYTGTKGGMEVYTRRLYEQFGQMETGFDFVAFVSREGAKMDLSWFPGRVVNSHLSGEIRLVWAFGELMVSAWAANAHYASLIHCPATLGPIRSAIPAVLTMHDMLYWSHPDLMSTPRYNRPVRWMEQKAARNATQIITDSRTAAAEIVRYLRYPADRLHVVPLASVRPPVRPGTEYQSENLILASGTRRPHKNWERLIRALSLVDKAIRPHLIITGALGDDPLVPIVASMGMTDWVDLRSWVSDNEMASLRCRARAIVIPTLAEGFGLPLIEAMAHGVPVIASDLPVLREVGDEAVLWFDPSDVESIAEAIRVVVTRADIAQSVRQAGLERAQHYSWERAAEETLKIFQVALKDRDRQAG